MIVEGWIVRNVNWKGEKRVGTKMQDCYMRCPVCLAWGSPPAVYISATATNYGSLSQEKTLVLAEQCRVLWRQEEEFPS